MSGLRPDIFCEITAVGGQDSGSVFSLHVVTKCQRIGAPFGLFECGLCILTFPFWEIWFSSAGCRIDFRDARDVLDPWGSIRITRGSERKPWAQSMPRSRQCRQSGRVCFAHSAILFECAGLQAYAPRMRVFRSAGGLRIRRLAGESQRMLRTCGGAVI